MGCAPFKTSFLRFEWETTILTLPLIAKNAMNGAQLRITHRGFDDRATCPQVFIEIARENSKLTKSEE
jgi:hypothetical protein